MHRLALTSVSLLLLITPSYASGVKPTPSDLEKIAQLEQRANKADPQEQCYLYAQLVVNIGQVLDQQLAAGDAEHAQQSLAKMEQYAMRVHQSINPKNKRLKQSEILVREAARRFDSMFHNAAVEQQDMLRNTLRKLNDLQDELMMHVFQQ